MFGVRLQRPAAAALSAAMPQQMRAASSRPADRGLALTLGFIIQRVSN